MDKFTRVRFGALAGGIAVVLAGMSGEIAAQDCRDPNPLVFSIIPTEETTQEVALYDPVVKYLSERTGRPVEFYMPTAYASVIEAMLGGWVHVGVHGPASYVIATEREPGAVEVFATYAKRSGYLQEEGPGYRAVLISRADSGIDSIEAAKGKILALVDPASTSGNLLPEVEFSKEIGMPLAEYFDRVVYSGGHDLSTMAVHEGQADVAFVATHRFDNVVERDMVKLEDFNVLWESRLVPQDPFTYAADLCPELKEQIRQTFLTLHEREEARGFLENVLSNRFVEMSDEDYDIIRDLRAARPD